MNIAILTPTYSYFSGPDRVVQQQAQELLQQGHQVTILALAAEMTPPTGANIIILGMPPQQFLQRAYRLFFFLDYWKIRRAVQKLQQMDKIICHMYPMTLIASKAKQKYNLHYTYYNMGIAYPHLFRTFLERTYMRLFSYLTTKTVQTADTAISISQFLQQELEKETGLTGTVELCTIGEKFHPHLNPTKMQEKYSLTYPTLLYVGRISPHKGVHLLLRAFEIVKIKYPQAKLLIVGKHTFDGYSKELQHQAAAINNAQTQSILFAGFVPDEELPFYYSACDVYTTATLWEGFDLPAAEAQACGKPVVAFNIGAHPEVVKNGILVPTGNVEEFGNAVAKILEKVRSKKKTLNETNSSKIMF